MSISNHILIIFLMVWANISALYACNCEPAAQPDVADWNDADVVFTATLSEHKMGLVGMLKFESREKYKGNVEPTVTFYFQPGKDHTLLHAVKDFNPGVEWIVFARKEMVGGKVHYRLKASPTRTVCALSRPIQEDREKDPYLLFLRDIAPRANGGQKIYNETDQLVAEGEYIGQTPIGEWIYHNPERKTSVSGQYIEGRREGEWVQRKVLSNGEKQIIRKTVYRNGVPVEIDDYRHTGIISLKKTLSDSTEVRHYFRYDGTLKSKIIDYFDDNSTHIINYSEGEAIQEERFLEANKVKRQYWYDEAGKRVKEWVEEEEN